tara:strand:- start:1241 stop:1621 length:381 start_codon:yes stop_codon:yes gene_type:complete
MPLYITERVSEIDITYNPLVKFVYFDTIKKDSTTPLTLLLRDQEYGLPIRFRNHMSSSGEWLDKDFDAQYRQLVSEDFKGVFDVLRNADLVIYPIRIFNIILSTLDTKAKEFFIRKFKDLEKHSEI